MSDNVIELKPTVTETRLQTVTDFDPPKTNRKYPWLEAVVGKSFAFPSTVLNPDGQVSSANRRYKDIGLKFALRKKDGINWALCIEGPTATQE